MTSKPFLYDHATREDAVLLEVIANPQPQVLRAKLLRIYSSRKGIKPGSVGKEIEFVHAPAVYGNTALVRGETALVFLSTISGKLYEASWQGHMVIEDIGGVSHAIFPHLVAGTGADNPSVHAIQDPKRHYARAIDFDVLETYLRNLIARIDAESEPITKPPLVQRILSQIFTNRR